MNIVIITEFPASALDVIREAAGDAAIDYYPAPKGQLPADVLARAEVFYTSGWAPPPQATPNLRWVQAHSAGVDHLIGNPLFATAEGEAHPRVMLTTASGVHAINISEYILMMLLALAHHLPLAFAMQQQGEWNMQRQDFLPQELHGATLGLIGYGAIGRQTARLAQALGMRVLALRRTAPLALSQTQEGVEFFTREQLPRLLSQSDYVALTAPLTPETRHILDRNALGALKPSAYVINISRGDLIDEEALIAALREGRLAGAALDVFAQEPLPMSSPLWGMSNVILTPHIAGITPNYEARAAELFAENLRRYRAGHTLLNRVDFARGY
jgi:phosphoglycerate dehydrogenase-like enzyme